MLSKDQSLLLSLFIKSSHINLLRPPPSPDSNIPSGSPVPPRACRKLPSVHLLRGIELKARPGALLLLPSPPRGTPFPLRHLKRYSPSFKLQSKCDCLRRLAPRFPLSWASSAPTCVSSRIKLPGFPEVAFFVSVPSCLSRGTKHVSMHHQPNFCCSDLKCLKFPEPQPNRARG